MKPRNRIGEQVAYAAKIVDNQLQDKPADPKKKPKRQPEATSTRQRIRG